MDVSLEIAHSTDQNQRPRTPAAATGPGTFLPSITTPKGGGALRGIGETFTTNLATGTASFSVPISTITGRNNFDLGLALSYDSGNGNDVLGLGWKLSVPSITRKTDKGIPRYGPEDTFILAGGEDLVPAPPPGATRETWQDGDYDIQTYRPRV
ncbi:MAG TPA: SpvB/TcaC N-terminal domain-containing protein, partial [Polyangiaceae bacterium]